MQSWRPAGVAGSDRGARRRGPRAVRDARPPPPRDGWRSNEPRRAAAEAATDAIGGAPSAPARQSIRSRRRTWASGQCSWPRTRSSGLRTSGTPPARDGLRLLGLHDVVLGPRGRVAPALLRRASTPPSRTSRERTGRRATSCSSTRPSRTWPYTSAGCMIHASHTRTPVAVVSAYWDSFVGAARTRLTSRLPKRQEARRDSPCRHAARGAAHHP